MSCATYLDDLYKRCVKAHTLRLQATGFISIEERRNIVTAEAEELRWILDQLSGLRDKFRPYLGINDLEGGA